MARKNTKSHTPQVRTHEGAPAVGNLKAFEQLKRSMLSSLLWESEYYEDGEKIADRIRKTAEQCAPEDVAALAVAARTTHNLRHAPLLLLDVLTRTGAGKPGLVSGAIEAVIQRSDELAEFMAIYTMGRKPRAPGAKPQAWALSKQAQKGLAAAFRKFDHYQLAKYNRDDVWKLKDVLFLAHPEPKDAEQKLLWERLMAGTLEAPDTWEVQISAVGKDTEKRKAIWTDLCVKATEGGKGGFGYMGLLRNLRNMLQDGVDAGVIRAALEARRGAHRVLPFRYIAAARAAPSLEPAIDKALCAAIAEMPILKGHTGVLVDVSGSMDHALSGKSDLKRIDAAAALASVINSEELTVASFSNDLAIVPPRRGMAGVDVVIKSQAHGGTYLGGALRKLEELAEKSGRPFDRLIVITDEQSHDPVTQSPKSKKAYMINVASYQNGVGYRGKWLHVDGFSEGVLKFIVAHESAEQEASIMTD